MTRKQPLATDGMYAWGGRRLETRAGRINCVCRSLWCRWDPVKKGFHHGCCEGTAVEAEGKARIMTKWKIKLSGDRRSSVRHFEGTARESAAFAKGCIEILGPGWGYTVTPVKPPIRVWICTVVLKHGDYTARSRISSMDAENKAILSANVGSVAEFETMHHEMTIEDKS